MGVPKFYRWASERYPCLSQVIQEHQVRHKLTCEAVALSVALNWSVIAQVLCENLNFMVMFQFFSGRCFWCQFELKLIKSDLSDSWLWQSLPGYEWHHSSVLSSKWRWSPLSEKRRGHFCWYISLYRSMFYNSLLYFTIDLRLLWNNNNWSLNCRIPWPCHLLGRHDGVLFLACSTKKATARRQEDSSGLEWWGYSVVTPTPWYKR